VGPMTLFDKSFLQSLSVDESVWFDHFFLVNVCPLFYVETLADLEKSVREGRTPEEEVRIIADKFPEMHGSPNAYHVDLCVANLIGSRVPFTGQIVLEGGRHVQVDSKTGVVFEQSPAAEAFTRWQRGEFLDIERLNAKAWRESLSSLDLGELSERYRALGIDQRACRSLSQAQALAKRVVTVKYIPKELMRLIHLFLSIPWELNDYVFSGWRRACFPSLDRYAPYAAHVLMVELFFNFALGANLIGTRNASNRVDIAYLFYLPFCMIFVSSDRLHRRCAPMFLRDDQEFVWGPDLKQDLAKLNDYYNQLPDTTKEQGVLSFAGNPPKEGDFLVAQLWDRHFPKWRQKEENRRTREPLEEMKYIEQIKRFTKAPGVPLIETNQSKKNFDMLAINRRVRKLKGSWWQVPKDMETTDD
jgi:hypothetical protein